MCDAVPFAAAARPRVRALAALSCAALVVLVVSVAVACVLFLPVGEVSALPAAMADLVRPRFVGEAAAAVAAVAVLMGLSGVGAAGLSVCVCLGAGLWEGEVGDVMCTSPSVCGAPDTPSVLSSLDHWGVGSCSAPETQRTWYDACLLRIARTNA